MVAEPTETRYLDLGGVRILAETLHFRYGNRITCPGCPKPEPPIRAYCKDEGGNGAAEQVGVKRRQFRCRNSVKKRRETGRGCAIASCNTYIARAITVLGKDRVEHIRREVEAKLQEDGRSTTSISRRLSSTPDPNNKPQAIIPVEPQSPKALARSAQTPTRPALNPPKRTRTEATLLRPEAKTDDELDTIERERKRACPDLLAKGITQLSAEIKILSAIAKDISTLLR